VRKQTDYEEYGGAPVLGVNGVSIVAHGRSRAKAIKNAIRVAYQAAEARLPETIAEGMRRLQAAGSSASEPASEIASETSGSA
jgi:glycerol-3-phosphate acyltransferase PlsX